MGSGWSAAEKGPEGCRKERHKKDQRVAVKRQDESVRDARKVRGFRSTHSAWHNHCSRRDSMSGERFNPVSKEYHNICKEELAEFDFL